MAFECRRNKPLKRSMRGNELCFENVYICFIPQPLYVKTGRVLVLQNGFPAVSFNLPATEDGKVMHNHPWQTAKTLLLDRIQQQGNQK